MAPRYGPKIVKDGLVLALDAANPKSYPGTGTTWFDLSGYGRNAIINGSPSIIDGYIDITGDTTYVSLSNSGLIPNTNDFTYCFWVKFDSVDGVDTIFENGSWTDTLLFRFENSQFTVYAEGSLRGILTWTPVIGSWVNLVLRRSGGIVDLKVNNISSGTPFSMSTDINLSNTNLWLMRSQHTTGQFTNGKLATCVIYNRGLSNDEIQQNFNALRGRYSI